VADLNWVQVGAKVASMGHTSLSITTVEKITATQIVLANGSRYSRNTGRKVGATAYDTHELLPVDHPRIRDRRIRAQIRQLGHKVDELCLGIKSSDEAASVLAEVEKAVAATRKRITELGGES